MRPLFILLAILSLTSLSVQETGIKSFPSIGLSFTIPDGWVGQESAAGYILGSYTEYGIVMLLSHQMQSIEQLILKAAQGSVDNQGTYLQLDGEIQKYGTNGIQANYRGTISLQPAKAHAIGLINSYGVGLTIIAMTTVEQFSENHSNLVHTIGESVVFKKVPTFTADKLAGTPEAWTAKLQNARFPSMDSYYSSGGSYWGYSTSGGYSDKVIIDLCGQGHFSILI